MPTPYGPRQIARNGQVVVPKEIMRAAGISPGELVYFVASEEHPGTVTIVPVALAVQWFERGQAAMSEQPETGGR